MSIEPFLAAAPVIQAHAAAAILALFCALGVTFLAKGTPTHVWTGRVYVCAMLLAAATSFWITGLRPGQFSWIHVLSVVTLISIPLAIYAVQQGNRRAHAIAMSCNALGLLIAGAFTLLPPRIMCSATNRMAARDRSSGIAPCTPVFSFSSAAGFRRS